jgi:hypothetical protein
VSNIDGNLDEYVKYVVDNIKYVIEEFGPRDPGNEGEFKAQEYIQKDLDKFVDETDIEEFKVAPKAFMAFLPVVGILNLISIIFYWFIPWVSVILNVLAIITALLEFLMYKKFLDPFFPKRVSHNLVGIKKPKGEIKKRIILSGHVDAAYEFRFSYINPKLLRLIIIPAIVGMLFKFIVDIFNVILNSNWQNGYQNIWGIFGIVGFCFLPIIFLILFFNRWSVVSPGANDNLTGTFATVAIAKYFQDKNIEFKDMEIRYLITGSEEAGLRGAKVYAKRHEKELKEIETIFIALETFKDLEWLSVYHRDMSSTVKNDPQVSKLLKNAGNNCGLDLPFGNIFIGASDAAAFTQAGIKASAIAAMDPAPPRYYHTRVDNWDILNPECIKVGMQVAIEAVQIYDEEGLPS